MIFHAFGHLGGGKNILYYYLYLENFGVTDVEKWPQYRKDRKIYII